MRAILLALVLTIHLATPAVAQDYDEGLAAYELGDYAVAYRNWRPLAEQGNAYAQYNLGVMYDTGKGVPPDSVQAHMWYNLAAAQSDEGSGDPLKRGSPYQSNEFSELVNTAQAGSGKSRLALAKLYVAHGLTPKSEQEAAKWLRKIVADGQEEYLLPAFLLAGEIRKLIRDDFPNISDAELEQANGSVGVAIARNSDKVTGVGVTIREALLLHHVAQLHLEIVYEYPVRGYQPHDPRILSFFKKTASERLPRSMFFLGKIFLNGWGVEADETRGRKLLEASELGEAYMALAVHAFTQENHVEAELYLNDAAAHDIPNAHFNLGVFAKNRGEYKEAIGHYQRTLELEPENHEARLNLAQLYSGEFGIIGKERLAFELMKKVADEADGSTAAIAQANVGFFYLNGAGVTRSVEMAKKYLEQAAAGGIEQAKKTLLEIQ